MHAKNAQEPRRKVFQWKVERRQVLEFTIGHLDAVVNVAGKCKFSS